MTDSPKSGFPVDTDVGTTPLLGNAGATTSVGSWVSEITILPALTEYLPLKGTKVPPE